MITYCPKCKREVDELRILEHYKDGNLPTRQLMGRSYFAEPCGDELSWLEYCQAAAVMPRHP